MFMYSVLIVSSGVSRNFKKYSQKFLYDWFNLIILTKAVSTRFFIFQDLSCLELFRHTSHIHLNKGLFWDLLSCFVTLVTKYSYLLVGKKKKKNLRSNDEGSAQITQEFCYLVLKSQVSKTKVCELIYGKGKKAFDKFIFLYSF